MSPRGRWVAQCELALEGGIQERFEIFHRDNPHVYVALVRLARRHTSRGATHLSIAYLYQIIRWETFLETDSLEPYKLNDHFHARYARLIMARESDLDGVFELRRLRSV